MREPVSRPWCTAASCVGCLLFCVCLSCTDLFSPGDGLSRVPACNSLTRGTLHDSDIDGSVSWSRAQSPHIIAGQIGGDTLFLAPGAIVCGQRGSTLGPARLVAIGTADEPITFTAVDTTSSWAGINIPFTRPNLPDGGSADLTHVRVRRTSGPGVRLRSGLIRNAVVDSACLAAPNCAAIEVTSYSTAVRVEDTTIRASGGAGISVELRSDLRLRGGSIEGSAGVGLSAPPYFGSSLEGVIVESPVRITGGRSYPAIVTMAAASVLTRDAAATAGLMGNARDTLIVHTWPTSTESTIRKGLPWKIHIPQASGLFGNVLRLEAGALLVLEWGGGTRTPAVELHVNGTALEPATVQGGGQGAPLALSGRDTVRVRHA